ncbi:MAG: chemotaxis protein CheW [Proteobacteria bacterium]|nr:chemotaxis protein CheW [Pseudomonadota bacterium]
MLLVLFKLQNDDYAIDSKRVVEIIPFLQTQKIPMTPKYITGMVNYRGTPVPVIDLGLLLNDQVCQQLYSTRIILTSVTLGGNLRKIVGLLAENVTETIKTAKDWRPKATDKGPLFLDNALLNHSMVRWFEPEQMLPDDIPGLSFMD